MKKICEKVNVFQGTRGCTVPQEGTLYSKWNMFKGKVGNTSPAARLPFSAVSCSPYSGGYSAGYGNFIRNGGENPESFFNGNKLIGFSHFNHSGVGGMGLYYNYLLTIPFFEDLNDIHELKEFDCEYAEPGYYKCRFIKENLLNEITVSNGVAIHRYTSLDEKEFKVAIDVSNDGLKQPFDDKVFAFSKQSQLKIETDGVSGFVVMQGVKLYFYVLCKNAKNTALWIEKKQITDKEINLEETKQSFGVFFDINNSFTELKIGFSLKNSTFAKKAVDCAPDFDEAKTIATDIWEKCLSTIEIFGASEQESEIFYSNYYHSLIKPCGWKGESFLWNETDTFYFDFATLWDVYKTQIPLIFTLHSDIGKGIVKTLLRYSKEFGGLFNTLLLSTNRNIEATQACCLGCYVLYDAYMRDLVDQEDVDDMFMAVKSEIEQYAQGIKDGTFEKTTKLLDCTLIAGAFAGIAKELRKTEEFEYFSNVVKYWTEAFGKDGLLKPEYPYYEGNYWNYSFRFVNDVQKRIALSGGKEKLIKQLDQFFAFDETSDKGDRFEGFNNETDMETPYFYHYVDGYDRLTTLLDECVTNCFKAGRDGLPGNNDSGGLSACYVWNFLGLYPISGQKEFFVGIPRVKEAILHLGNGNTLIIKSCGEGKSIDKVLFNDNLVLNGKISVHSIMKGGTLTFIIGSKYEC